MFIQYQFTVKQKGDPDADHVIVVVPPSNLLLGLADERLKGTDESELMANTMLALIDKLEKDNYEFLKT